MPRQNMTIRLDEETRTRLVSAARRRRKTPSAVVRAALDAWLADDDAIAGSSPYEVVSDLVGCVRGGDPRRSISSARAIRDALRDRGRRTGR